MKKNNLYKRTAAMLSTFVLIFTSVFALSGVSAYADDPSPDPVTTTVSITKELTGSDMPSDDAEFEFAVTDETGAPAAGMMDKGNGALDIPADGVITLKNNETVVLSGLKAGKYTITETKPSQSNYADTDIDVDGTVYNSSLETTVEVKNVSKPGGGWIVDSTGELKKDDDGFFTYIITPEQIDENGEILIDFDPFAERLGASMNQYVNWSRISSKIKLVNESGEEITYKDYSFDTHNYIHDGSETIAEAASPSFTSAYGYGFGTAWDYQLDILSGNTDDSPLLNVTGFEGTGVRAVSAPLRTTNPAVISYFRSNPHTGTLTSLSGNQIRRENVTLLQMNSLNELIKEAFTFNDCNGNAVNVPADPSRTYADFICLYYGVGSLSELDNMQKYNTLGTGYNSAPSYVYEGQSAINGYKGVQTPIEDLYIPDSALTDSSLNYFMNWGFASELSGVSGYSYKNNYYILENDPLVTAMGYEYLYDRCMRFTFDNDTRPVYTGTDNSASAPDDVSGIKSYIDRTTQAVSHVETSFKNGEWLADTDVIELPNVKGYIEVPNAFNQFRIYDFGFDVTFMAKEIPPKNINVTFTNDYSKIPTPDPPTPTPTPDPPKPTPTPDPPKPTPTPDPPKPAPKGPAAVKTGDESSPVFWFVMLASSGIIMSLGYIKIYKNNY